MQKIINALAVISFVGTASIVGAGGYVYLNKDSLVDQVREKITKAVTEAVTGSLPSLVGDAVPEMPDVTGPAMLPQTPSFRPSRLP